MQNHSLCFFSLNLDNCFYHKEICDNIQNQLFVSDENYCNCEEFQCRTELVDDPDSIECCILEAREARTINQNSNKIEYVNKVSGMAMVIGSITVNSNFDDEYMIILTPPPYVNLYFMSKPVRYLPESFLRTYDPSVALFLELFKRGKYSFLTLKFPASTQNR